MATLTLGAATVIKTISGNSPQILVLPEGASNTGKKGELCYLSGGYVTEIGSNPNLILGMLAEDAHNDDAAGTSEIAVYIANSDTIFEFNKVSTAAGAGTGGTGAATAVTDIGKAFGLYRDTTLNITHATVAEGASASQRQLMCVDLSDKDTVGDTGGRLQCIVNGNFRQLYCTS